MFGRGRRRSTTRRTTAGLEISIPAKLHLFVLVFLSVWLAIGGAVEFFVLRTLLTEPDVSLGFWFIFWTLAGGAALYICLWMIAGKEIITLQSGVLTITHMLFGWIRAREYDLQHISNLRVDPEPYDSEGPRLSAVYPFRTGPIAFEYRGKTLRFADGVSEAEAQEIVAALTGTSLAPPDGTHRTLGTPGTPGTPGTKKRISP